jgi:tRNA pseudouridine55 synthase
LKVKKAGHTGTLDPFATGVLICCLNQATRLARFFLHGGKKYRAELRLGIETDTQDATGAITATGEQVDFTEEEIRSVFKRFKGNILQQPPVFSALKHRGVPLYKLAREGRPVQKPAREVQIFSIQILEIALPYVRFEAACSGGTYMRTLCADIGANLGCGGHLSALRRIESSGFSVSEAITPVDLERLARRGHIMDRIIPMADALRHMPAYVAETALTEKIVHGRTLTQKDFVPTSMTPSKGLIKIVDEHNNLCAVLDVDENSGRYNYCCVFS